MKFEREKRLKRIIEMEKSLCKELGEQGVVCASKTKLPSEEELRGHLKRVEALEQTLVCVYVCACVCMCVCASVCVCVCV